MTPGARAQAVIDLLDKIFPLSAETGGTRGMPPDRLLKRWARENRYAGAKDRRAIQALFYEVLRHLGPLLSGLGEAASPRLCVAALLNRDGEAADTFTGQNYAPASLTAEEATLLADRSIDWSQPNFPGWMVKQFENTWGDRASAIMESLNQQAALDVRVNLKKASLTEVMAALAKEGVSAIPVPWCHSALRIEGNVKVDQTQAFAKGNIEVQDAGSQMIAALCAKVARPGAQVLDFCAGAGGKTLALLDMLNGKARVVASDIDGKRLGRMTPRLQRIGNPDVERVPQTPDALTSWADAFDMVLVDAPCSGSGAWARDPLAPWQTSEDMFEGIRFTQGQVLDKAAACVKPNGWLAYVTCSLFEEENSQQVDAFLARHPHFKPQLPGEKALKDLGLSPENMANGQLTITPDRPLTGPENGMTSDGFFIAMLRREGQTSE